METHDHPQEEEGWFGLLWSGKCWPQPVATSGSSETLCPSPTILGPSNDDTYLQSSVPLCSFSNDSPSPIATTSHSFQ